MGYAAIRLRKITGLRLAQRRFTSERGAPLRPRLAEQQVIVERQRVERPETQRRRASAIAHQRSEAGRAVLVAGDQLAIEDRGAVHLGRIDDWSMRM